MVRVMASGVFDILHTGHISYLEQAKAMGDELIVVVACDNTVRRRKHEPITPEAMRARIISSLRPVDATVIGKDGDMFLTIEEIRPDIIVLGYDQAFDEDELRKELKERNIRAEVRRAGECADDLTGTRRIVSRIIKEFGEGK
ncbi:MAG: FAD synthase [Methanomassiliicoccaceae archaeon]|jgi:FAD synthetase|nr:FAD synthase [Methanomassiliicoccaceae archaeon]